MRPLLAHARYLVLIAVIGALAAATCLLVYGFLQGIQLIVGVVDYGAVSSKGAKALALEFIEIIDLFLMGTVFYIVSVGLYSLFIDSTLPLPDWLKIRTLDDLKNKLVAVVIVVLAVVFLGKAVTGDADLMGAGAGIAAVIAALTYFLSVKSGKAAEK